MKHTWLLAGLAGAVILTAILFTRTSDNRDTSCVETALHGHWLATNGDALYYGPNRAIALTPEGTKSYHPYRILMSNERESWMKILIANNDGKDVERVIQFNEDRDAYQTAAVILLNGKRTERFATVVYEDDKTSP